MSSDDYSYDYKALEVSRIVTIVIGSIAILFPLSVVFILLQRYNSLVKGKSLIHYILMIAIADTLTALSYTMGYPKSGILCELQSFMTIFFPRMSWFFTNALVIQLFSVVVFAKHFLNLKYMHVIVWSLNVLLQILPVTTGTSYGTDDDYIPLAICLYSKGIGTIQDRNRWNRYAFDIPLFISFAIIIILSTIIVLYSLRLKNIKSSNVYLIQRIQHSWSIVILYPLAMLVSWVPFSVWSFYSYYLQEIEKEMPKHYYLIFDYLNALTAMYGILLALIFYTKTSDAKQAWIYNFRYIFNILADKAVDKNFDERSTCSSIISMQDSEVRSSELSTLSKLTNPIHEEHINRIP